MVQSHQRTTIADEIVIGRDEEDAYQRVTLMNDN